MKGTVLIGLGALWGTSYYLGRTWGATCEERRRTLPGDELVPGATLMTDHAITIDAAPDEVWPWLRQVGWHRGGWYTYRWVDRLLFPNNAASADDVVPELQHLAVGDDIPDGPPESGCFFRVEAIEPERLLVLRSTTHLPPALLNKPGVVMNWSWSFALSPLAGGRTRFHFRTRLTLRPLWLRLLYEAFVVPADFIMGRSMCKGLKRRVEARRRGLFREAILSSRADAE